MGIVFTAIFLDRYAQAMGAATPRDRKGGG